MVEPTKLPKSSLRNNIMIAFFLVIVLFGASVTATSQHVLRHALVEAGLPQEAVQHVGREFMQMLTGLTLAGMVLALTIAGFLSKTMTEPIQRLLRGVAEIRSGKLDATIDIPGEDELGRLAQAFNGMMQQLRQSHEELEERVKQRTAELSAVNKVMASEIAQRERAEAELRESEEKFRVLFEVSADAIMTLEPPTWKFTSGNPATVKVFQAKDETQFVSKGPWDVSPEFQPDGTRSDDKAKAMIGKAMQEGSNFFEWDHMRLDGEVFPATVLLTRVTLGEKVFLQATVRDITEAKKAQSRLAYLASFPEQNPSPIVEANLEGHIRYANPAARRLLADLHEQGPAHPWLADWATVARQFGEGQTDVGLREVTIGERIHEQRFHYCAQDGFVRIYSVDITERKTAAERLRRSEEEHRSLFENMRNGFAYCEMLFENGQPQDFTYIKVNDAFEKLTGLKDVVGKRVTEVIPGIQTSNPELFEIYGRVALTGQPESFEAHLNTIGWLSVSVYSPKKGYFVAIFDNITERKTAEDQIRQNSQVQSALNGLLSLSLDDLTTEEVLQQAIDHMTSLPWFALSKGAIFLADDPQQMLVMAAQRGLPTPLLTICAHVPFGGCICGKAASSGQIEFADCVDERHENTFEGLSPHGHYAVPILSAGKVLGVINLYVREGHLRSRKEEDFLRAAAAVLAGIIERKRAEQELKVAAEQWDATFNSIADLVSVQDASFRLVRVNKAFAEIFGKNPEQLIGRPCYEIVHGRNDPWPDCPCRTVFETNKPARVDIFDPALGAYLEVCASPLFGPDGEVIGCVHIAKNITERKQADQKQAELLDRLAGINQELRDFAYVVSHDLKAPLRAIRNLADWLSADYQDKLDPPGKENLQLLSSRVDRMQNLIDGVLQYSRVGRTEQGTKPVDLGQIVPEIIENLSAPEHISIRVESDLPMVEADPTRITQVFQNLLSNAIKYMDKPQGNIAVGCVEEDGFWKFRVSDNGPGIEEKHFERIFKLFQTLAPRDGSESTGVGLTITKKVVEMYGGKIWVESEVGQGSSFFFTFPKSTARVGEETLQTCAVGS